VNITAPALQTNLAFAFGGYGSAGEQPERQVKFSKQSGAAHPCRFFHYFGLDFS